MLTALEIVLTNICLCNILYTKKRRLNYEKATADIHENGYDKNKIC